MISTRRHPELDDSLADTFLEQIETIFSVGETLSIGAKQLIKLCQIGETSVIIKRYESNGPFSALRLLCGVSRIDNSCRFASFLEKFKIPCPKHLLTIKQLGFTKNVAYLVMEKAPGTPLFNFIQAESSLSLSQAAIDNVAKLITQMQWLGIAHGDLHTRNFIISDDDTVQIIDLDSCKSSKNHREKDIERFTKAVNQGARYKQELTSALKKAMKQPANLN